MDPNKTLDRLVLRLKVNSLSHCGLVAPLILFELLTLNCTEKEKVHLTQGHCVVNGTPNWHLWVTYEDQVFDVSARLVVQSGLDKIEYHGSPCNCDLTKLSGSLDLVSQWETYKESPSKFWAQVPMKTQSVRRDILKRFKSGKI